MKNHKTLSITLSMLAFLVLSGGVAYAASGPGFQRFDNLSEEQIQILEQARDLREEGDMEGARELLEESGLPVPGDGEGRRGMGMRPEFSEEMMARHEEIRAAIENNDYETFLSLTEDSPRKVEISEEDFDKLVTAHSLRLEGKYDEAREIMDELGLHPGPHGHGPRMDDEDSE